jgi:chromatin remodeling complex protein RSC6
MNKTTPSKPATKTTKAPKAKTIETPVPVPVPVAEPEPAVVEVPVAVEAEAPADSMKDRFESLIQSRQVLIADLKREVLELRKMQRDYEAAMKEAAKKNKKKKVRDDSVPRKPSGFASPVLVSDELYGFLKQFGVEQGQPIARTDVTRHITGYIKNNDLQNPQARREIVPDAVLQKLFSEPLETNANGDKVYSYLRLQKYISHHFAKKQQA